MLNWSKVVVKIFIMLQKVFTSNIAVLLNFLFIKVYWKYLHFAIILIFVILILLQKDFYILTKAANKCNLCLNVHKMCINVYKREKSHNFLCGLMSLFLYCVFSFYCSLLHTLSLARAVCWWAQQMLQSGSRENQWQQKWWSLLDMEWVWLSPPFYFFEKPLRQHRKREKAFWLMPLAWRCNKVKIPFFCIHEYPHSQTHTCI